MSGVWDEKRKRLHYLEWRGLVFHSECKTDDCKNYWMIKSTDEDYGREFCHDCLKAKESEKAETRPGTKMNNLWILYSQYIIKIKLRFREPTKCRSSS